MRIGTSLTLVAVGLILVYAVDFELPGIEVGTLGAILFYVGLLGLLVSVGLEVMARRAPRPRRSRAAPRAPGPPSRSEPPARDYDPVVPRRPRDPAEDETRRLPPR